VLPHVRRLPDRTVQWLESVRDAGGTILDVGQEAAERRETNGSDPGSWRTTPEAELGTELRAAGLPDLRIEPTFGDVGFVHRAVEGADIYFVVNAGAHIRRFSVVPRATRSSWQRWDAQSGTVVARGEGAVARLELAPYEAAVLVFGDDLPTEAAVAGTTRAGGDGVGRQASSGATAVPNWTVSFDGEEPTSVELPHDWTEQRPHYAGTAVYEHAFEGAEVWGSGVPARVELDFGEALPIGAGDAAERGMRGASYRAMVEAPVREVAAVSVNGVDCGMLYAPPYRVDVSKAVSAGENHVRVVVGNATAAALAAAETARRLEADVAASHERYGMRFRMQDVEHAADGLRSGLLSIPVLRWWAERGE
jgi:hypothetical protein